MARTLLALQNRQQALAHQRIHFARTHLLWVLRLTYVEKGRHEINQMPRLMRDTARLGLQAGWPVRDHRRADAAFVLILFV